MSRSNVFILILVLMLGNGTIAHSSESVPTKKINLQEPPFWLMSFEEFTDLRTVQKELYLDQLAKELNSIKDFQKQTRESLRVASQKARSWELVMIPLYQYCANSHHHSKCEAISTVRLKTFEKFENERIENRSPKEE